MNYKEFKDKNKIDPELEALIAELRDVPPRDPRKAERTKSLFLTEIEKMSEKEPEMAHQKQVKIVRQIKEYFEMATPRMKKVYQTAAIAVFVVALLFGGAGITAVVASNSLPGDNLYPIKARIEQTRVQLTSSSEDKISLNLQFAQERLNEIELLIAEGRLSDIAEAVRAYERYIQRALSELAEISANDPERAQMLFNQIAESLKSFSLAFENVSLLTGGQDLTFDDVIRFSQSAGSFSGKLEFTEIVTEISEVQWVVGGYNIVITSATEFEGVIDVGDLVKVEAWIDTEGKIYAIEVKETSDADDAYEGEFEISGIVSEVGEGYLILNGLRFEFGPESEFDDEVETGDMVKIEAKLLGGGGFIIDEIELDYSNDDIYDDDDDDMYDDDDDDIYDDDDDDMYNDDDDNMYDDDDDDMYDDDDDDMYDDGDDDMYDDDDDDIYDDEDDDMSDDDDDMSDDDDESDDDDMYDDDDD